MKKTDNKAKGCDMTKSTKSAVILRWNPAFSSFGTESLVYSLGEMNAHPRGHLDWSASGNPS